VRIKRRTIMGYDIDMGAFRYHNKGLFGSVIAVTFQIAFHAKMHANDVFLFFKNYF
jgi:hypothetical protein